MKKRSASHLIDLLFPLALFCAFAITSLLVVVIGADVYRRTTEGMERNFTLRTSLSYLSQAVHRNDLANSVALGTFGDADALVLQSEIEGSEYITYLYCYEGSLRELFVRADVAAFPENGQIVSPLRSFSVEEAGAGIFRFRCTSLTGEVAEALAGIRSPQSGA